MATATMNPDTITNGVHVVGGTVVLDGTNPTTVTVGSMTTIVSATATIGGAVTPGDDPVTLTVAVSGNVLSIYAWGHNGTDPTLVASTNSTDTIHYTIVGY